MGSITTTCIYGNGLIYERNGDIYQYHHYNNFGSTMKLTDAKGQVTASYTYGVYGELLSGDTRLTRFLYNGRCGVTTDDNGLYYMRQRYYNPETKRFVNQDVLTGSISNSQSLNRYSYVQGNPVSYTDPFGLSPLNGLFTGTTFVHCLFGVLGCIPGPVGVVANLADAIVYALVDHDYLMAGISVLGAVTLGVGSIAAKAAKGSKLARGAKYVQQASSFLSSGLMFAKNFDNAAQVGGGMYEKYAVRGESFSKETLTEISALSMAVLGCGLSAYGMASSGKELAKMLKEDNVASRLKNFYQAHALNNGGYVDLDALADTFKPKRAKTGGRVQEGHSIIVTDDVIKNAMKDAPLQTQQSSVSKPVIQNYVDRILASETKMPPIKVDNKIIVDGNHRYIASRIAGVSVDIIQWSGGNQNKVISWMDVILDAVDWGNR